MEFKERQITKNENQTIRSTAQGPRSGKPHPDIPAAGDHKAWAAYWGEQAISAMNTVLHETNLSIAACALEHTKRAGRMAWYHACRLKGYKYWDTFWTKDPK